MRTVLKFGGTSLSNGKGLEKSIEIIEQSAHEPIAVVVSARGKATDQLIDMYVKAVGQDNYEDDLNAFYQEQVLPLNNGESIAEFRELGELLSAIKLIGVDDFRNRNKVLAYGEVISARVLEQLLCSKGLSAKFIDSRQIIVGSGIPQFRVDFAESTRLSKAAFSNLEPLEIPIVTGFISKDDLGQTRTLGRNGSNYTASILAQAIDAKEVQNWTDVDGIYTADPRLVREAKKIKSLTYREAHELANFGMNVLHTKTIKPLVEKAIPLKIRNTFKPELPGTEIKKETGQGGIKAVSVIEGVSLITIEGSGLIEHVGIDSRIFKVLSDEKINIKLISQASSERGIGFVIDEKAGQKAVDLLQKEFESEVKTHEISGIKATNDVAVIAIIGRHNYALEKAISGLRKNGIWMHLINNSISGEHISLVVDKKHLKKAVRVVHTQVFNALKTLHVFAFGKGTVGSAFIDQVLQSRQEIIEKRKLQIQLIGIADTLGYSILEKGYSEDWKSELRNNRVTGGVENIISDLKRLPLENIVIIDNTSSADVSNAYPQFVDAGFDIVASNKKFNSSSFGAYANLRKLLRQKNKHFFYETNVGAGLPLIDTLRQLHESCEDFKRIKGVFSGSLSYIFNRFSSEDKDFVDILLDAKKGGFTEPDAREDLSGLDVARKLLIVAREIGLAPEMEDIQVESLIPSALDKIGSWENFIAEKETINAYFSNLKKALKPGEVLRYVGTVESDGSLHVGLEAVSSESPLGRLQNADSFFEISTQDYGDFPVIIQGAGAGAAVTARGVYSDVLRIGQRV